MIERLQTILKNAELSIESAVELKNIDEIRVKYLGKSGELTEILKGLNQIPAPERPSVGKVSNDIKNKIMELLERKKDELDSKASSTSLEGWDPTLPGRKFAVGKIHPLVCVQKEITEIFKNLGFDVAEGPDLETDYYNFLALNFPPDHPARDAQDTFYVRDKVLRTHTSPIQVREMEKRTPPFKFIAPGRVYRNEAVDATHHHIFHQVEGFLVAEGIHFGHLKGVLDVFIKKFFGPEVKTRFRPSFFPFTEPSAEMDISCVFCKNQGCRICKQSGWVEMMGCGMIDPVVLKNCKINDEQYSGFAFGMGVERIALFKYGIDDIRLFYQNDIRFLDEF